MNHIKKKEKTSQYKGVHWYRKRGTWHVQLRLKGGKRRFGGFFKDEEDAGKRVNQLCEELGIPAKNPTISAMPNQQLQKKEKASQYKGVYWSKQNKKWYAQLVVKGEKTKHGGYFNDELDAGKRCNQLCEDFRIPLQNPDINAMPNEQYQIREKSSQYKGVCWDKERGKWFARVSLKGEKQYGGRFNHELDAAKRVNEICKDFGIPQQNPSIGAIPNKNCKKEKKCTILLDYDAIKAELNSLIKIIDENNDSISTAMKKKLIVALKYGEEAKMTEINCRTKDGESMLSIAVKHGFSNTDWITPNSHETQYLHLSPIFNVKSREIAQLLIDNDAVTHDIYNNEHQSPLTVACQHGYLDVVEFFLDDGLDINHLDNDNKTSPFYILANKHHNLSNRLISKKVKN